MPMKRALNLLKNIIFNHNIQMRGGPAKATGITAKGPVTKTPGTTTGKSHDSKHLPREFK